MEWSASGSLVVPTYSGPTIAVQPDNQGNFASTDQLTDGSGNLIAQEELTGNEDSSGNVTATDQLTDPSGNIIAQENITGQVDSSGNLTISQDQLTDPSGNPISQSQLATELSSMGLDPSNFNTTSGNYGYSTGSGYDASNNVGSGTGNGYTVDPLTGLTVDDATEANIDAQQSDTLNSISDSAVAQSQEETQDNVTMTNNGMVDMEAAEDGEDVYQSDGEGNETEVESYGDD